MKRLLLNQRSTDNLFCRQVLISIILSKTRFELACFKDGARYETIISFNPSMGECRSGSG